MISLGVHVAVVSDEAIVMIQVQDADFVNTEYKRALARNGVEMPLSCSQPLEPAGPRAFCTSACRFYRADASFFSHFETHRRPTDALARDEIELPAVAGADQVVSFDETIRERTAVMGAAIGCGDGLPIGQGCQDQRLLAALTGDDPTRRAACPRLGHGRPRGLGFVGIFSQEVTDLGVDARFDHQDTSRCSDGVSASPRDHRPPVSSNSSRRHVQGGGGR